MVSFDCIYGWNEESRYIYQADTKVGGLNYLYLLFIYCDFKT